MKKVNLKYLGEKPSTFRHGNLVIEFQPDDTKEVEAHHAELLLAEAQIERTYKREGGIESEERTPLFEAAAAETVSKKKGEQK